MITEEEWMTLKQGDILAIETKKKGSYLRTILEGPADSPLPWARAITIPKIRRSWTGRPYTMYFHHEMKDRATKLKTTNAHLINTYEHECLLKQGINPRKALVKEVREQREDLKRRAEFEERCYGSKPFRPCRFQIKRISKVS